MTADWKQGRVGVERPAGIYGNHVWAVTEQQIRRMQEMEISATLMSQ